MSAIHPIFAYSSNKFNLASIIKNSYNTFFENFSYLTISFNDDSKLVLKNISEVEKEIGKLISANISSFSLSNDISSFEFISLLDSNLEISFYIDFSQSKNKEKILKYIFDLLISNKADLAYLSNLDDDFENHYEVQKEIVNLINTEDYSQISDYIKEKKHYFCIVCFKNKSLNTCHLKEDFKINTFTYLFLQNQKDEFI